MQVEIAVLCPFGADLGLISKAVALAGDAPVRVLVPEEDATVVASHGVQRIHTLNKADIPADEHSFALWLAQKATMWGSTVVLAPATIQLRGILPMLAWKLQAGLTADCTDLALESGHLLQTRPAFGNSLMATIQTRSPVEIATVRPGTFPAIPKQRKSGNIVAETVSCDMSAVTQTEFRPFTDGTPLGQAQIVIAGGLGIGSKDGFTKLETFAKKIGGAVAASRNAVDAGFVPYRCQVGMTGITVCPKIYIAVGISGAVQHLAGMSGAETVIAINSDEKAPIFDYADYGIVGNWESVIDKLLEELS